ncbi:MAG: 50S ribosomal protein L17 [Candidatus Dojkabacteria bacterium]|nr:50S ribosomal protein L17 [Candidatus Dojkabacteria bacterium]
MYKRIKKIKINKSDKEHAMSVVKNLVFDLCRYGKVKTTVAKAKVVKAIFDKLVTKCKKNTPHTIRQLQSFFNNNHRIVKRLQKLVSNYLSDRSSGYTKLLRTLPRKGDNAQMAYLCVVNLENKDYEKKSLVDKLRNAAINTKS